MRQRFALPDREPEEISRAERPYAAPLTPAKGAAAYIPVEDTDYTDVFKRADQTMNEDKMSYYEKQGGSRRT
ncbi:MAG: hypothetical protein J5827_03410 [Oscillospiraceae bacterium]|nr:hypothetical protein [Oscillospiraceae bacterium]